MLFGPFKILVKTRWHVFADALQSKNGTPIWLPQIPSVEFKWLAKFERIDEVVDSDELTHEYLHYGVRWVYEPRKVFV